MARANRSRRGWFLAVLVVVAAVVVIAARGCDDDVSAQRTGGAGPRSVESKAPESQPRHADAAAPDVPADAATDSVAPNEEPADKVKFRISVTHPDGSPAAGATVVLLNTNGSQFDQTVERGLTGVDGSVTLDVPNWIFRVAAWSGDEAAVLEDTAMAPSAAVRLEPANHLRGRVVQQNGEPVPSAEVRFHAGSYRLTGVGLSLRAATDADGSFEILLPRSALDGQTDGVVEAQAPRFIPALVPLDEQIARSEIVVVMERGIVVRGRLVLPGDTPPVGDLVVQSSNRTHVRTQVGSDGAFELTLPAGGDRVVAVREWSVEVIDDPGHETRTEDHGTALLLGDFTGRTADVDLGIVPFPAGRPVEGVVVDREGKPLPGVGVDVWLFDVCAESVSTDADGRFRIQNLGPDPHELFVVERSTQGGRARSVEGVRGGDADLRVVLTGERTIHVHVRIADSAFSRSLRLLATWRGEAGEGEQVYTINAPDSVRVFTDRPGACNLTLTAKGFDPATVLGIQVPADRDTAVEITLHEKPNFPADAGTVLLRFVDAETKAVARTGHVEVSMRLIGESIPAVVLSSMGGPMDSYRVEPGRPGTWDVTVRMRGYEPAMLSVEVSEERGSSADVLLRKRTN